MKFLCARVVVIVTGLVPACSSSRVEKISVTPKPTDVSRPSASPAPGEAPLTFEVLRADTPRTTAQGTSFIAPKDWKIAVRGAATLLEFVVDNGAKRTLKLREGQHEYTFTEK